MCHGPLFSKIILFALPLVMTYVLQLLFYVADLITMELNSLVINVFIGLSVGSNIVAARAFGAGDRNGMHKAVHTTMNLAFWGGLVLMIVGLLVAKPLPLCGGLRGLGYSVLATVYCLVGACILRIIWVLWIFPHNPTMEFLLLSCPISWAAVAVANVITLIWAYRKEIREKCPRTAIWKNIIPA